MSQTWDGLNEITLFAKVGISVDRLVDLPLDLGYFIVEKSDVRRERRTDPLVGLWIVSRDVVYGARSS